MKEVTLYKVSTETIVVESTRDYLEVCKVASLPQRILNSDEVVAFRDFEIDTTPIHRLCCNDNGVTRHWYVAYDNDLREMLDEYTALTQSKFDELKSKLDIAQLEVKLRKSDLESARRELTKLEKYQEMFFWQRLKWAFKGG